MEKDIGKIPKNPETDIILRIDDFGGQRGLTIREFVSSDRYTGFTKAGVRIKSKDFADFKKMINSISDEDLKDDASAGHEQGHSAKEKPKAQKKLDEEFDEEMPDY